MSLEGMDEESVRTRAQVLETPPDMVILGGGPCGCSAAIAARKAGARVMLVTRRSPPAWRPRELVPITACSGLSRLGINGEALLKSHLHVPRMKVAWGNKSFGEQVTAFGEQNGRVLVDRAKFDADLLDATGGIGVSVVEESCHALERDHNSWRIRLQSGLSLRTVRLLIATGRAGSAGTRRNPVLCADHLVGISLRPRVASEHVGNDGRAGAAGDFFVASGPSGWWYGVLGQAWSSFAVYLTDPDLLPRGWRGQPGKILTLLPRQFLLPECSAQSSVRLMAHPAATSARAAAAGPGWALAGDARLSVDPLSGGGLSRAVEDGARIGTWLLSDPSAIERQRFRFLHAAEYNDLLAVRARTYAAEERHSSVFWSRRRQAGPDSHSTNLRSAQFR